MITADFGALSVYACALETSNVEVIENCYYKSLLL